jgi:hypothetical protein
MATLRSRWQRIGAARLFAGWHAEDGSVLAVFAIFWAVSLARVIAAVVRHEVFGGEETLALMAVVAVPWLVLAGGARSQRSS